MIRHVPLSKLEHSPCFLSPQFSPGSNNLRRIR
jgi:hypothetical protein